MFRKRTHLIVFLLIVVSVVAGATVSAAPNAQRWEEEIVIGWAPPDITGVFKTATDFFEAAAADANENGFNVTVITQSPASHTDFGDQVAIIEDYIQREVDVIAISPIEVEVVKPALAKANEAGIPVIVVNLLEPIEGIEVASYIGFDNTIAAKVSAYAVADYFGGPGVLGEGEVVEVELDTYLDLEFWEGLYSELTEEGNGCHHRARRHHRGCRGWLLLGGTSERLQRSHGNVPGHGDRWRAMRGGLEPRRVLTARKTSFSPILRAWTSSGRPRMRWAWAPCWRLRLQPASRRSKVA